MSNSKHKCETSLLSSHQRKKISNDSIISYHSFNKSVHSHPNYYQKHACKTYEMKNYGSKAYKKLNSSRVGDTVI